MKINITPFTIKAYDGVLALWQQAEGVGLHDNSDSREEIQSYLERNPGMSFVATADGKASVASSCRTVLTPSAVRESENPTSSSSRTILMALRSGNLWDGPHAQTST